MARLEGATDERDGQGVPMTRLEGASPLCACGRRRVVILAIAFTAAFPALATEFRSTGEAATILYDAPSAKAKPAPE